MGEPCKECEDGVIVVGGHTGPSYYACPDCNPEGVKRQLKHAKRMWLYVVLPLWIVVILMFIFLPTQGD